MGWVILTHKQENFKCTDSNCNKRKNCRLFLTIIEFYFMILIFKFKLLYKTGLKDIQKFIKLKKLFILSVQNGQLVSEEKRLNLLRKKYSVA